MDTARMKCSKHAKGFVEKYNIERFLGLEKFDPNQFTEEEKKNFAAYKKEQLSKYSSTNYQQRVVKGTVPQYKPREELSFEKLENVRKNAKANARDLNVRKRRLREFAKKNGIPVRNNIKDDTMTSLRNAIAEAGISVDQRKKIENDSALDKVKINKDDLDDETKRKRALSAEISGKGHYRRKALYDEATKYAAMPPFPNMTIETIRRILRGHLDKDEIDEIESKASREYDDTHELVPRKEPISRSSELLNKFFEAFPDVPRVTMVGQMSSDDQNKYNGFKRDLDREGYRARSLKWDAGHREERAEKARVHRVKNPVPVAKTQKKYKKSKKGTLISFFQDTRRRAIGKEITFQITKERIIEMSKEPCFYCGDLYDEYCIDAVDVATGFVEGNIKPCCRLCNTAKKDHHYKDFIRMMCNIGVKHTPASSTIEWTPIYNFVNPKKNIRSCTFERYAESASRNGREFQITESEIDSLTNNSCHYCGILKKNGIDRLDSKQGYIPGNMVAACGPCNMMKRHFSHDDFIEKAVKILPKWLPEIRACSDFFNVNQEANV